MSQSFFCKMAEEKDLLNQCFTIIEKDEFHTFEVSQVIELIENSTPEEQEIIKEMFSKIDFHNGDLLHYIKFLADCFLKKINEEPVLH